MAAHHCKPFTLQYKRDMPSPVDTYRKADPAIFTSLIDSLPLHVFAKDKEGRFIHANRSYCRRIGVPLAKLIGLDDFDIHPPELAEKYRRDDIRIMESGRSESCEEQWQTQQGDGKRGWVQTIRAPLRNHTDNEIIGMIGIFWDITEKKKGELALAEERNLLRTLIDNLPDLIYVKDAESRFLVANVAVARQMGASSPDKLTGKRDRDYYPPEQADNSRSDEVSVIATGQAVIDKEECLSDLSGRKKWMRTTKLPLKNLAGEIIGIVGIGHDITRQRESEEERQRLENHLHHAQRMETIGTLAAGIAHDFNNLLSVINGYSELMQLTCTTGSPQHENLGRVLAAGRSAAKLVGQLLAFSRKQAAQARVIDLNGELKAIRPMLKRIIGEYVRISLDLADGLWPVRMDPAQLEQVVANMAANARDAMPEGGELIFRTENVSVEDSPGRCSNLGPGDWVMLSVRDTGEGIQPEAKEHLFEPFFTTKPKHQGTGLGLATVFGIIKQNKGHIVAENLPDGSGAEFVIYLRKSEEPLPSTTAEPTVLQRCYNGHETILVVEDDEDVRNLVAKILTDNGYSVLTAGNGAEAILAVEQKGKDLDLILTDVIMPGINGRMLADEMARRKASVKMLFMSGYAGEVISRYGIIEPEVAFLQKPFSAGELVRKIRFVLDG